MRRLALLSTLLLVAACGGAGDHGGMEGGDSAAVAAMPETISLADVAGTWDFKAMVPGADSATVEYQIVATADMNGWTVNLPGRDPIPLTVTTSGDSIMTTTGSFESILREGVQVTTESVMRLENGVLVGTTTARYATGADSVVTLHAEGTRAQ